MELHQGGKFVSPQALTQVSDWGEQMQPTQRQLQV
ncbi:MAG TPA: addiction module toxin RelE [Serratia grimesii]|uniref:Addiction module toxin RelE n=1 Tax=Serratia grimesii TaxID=82995 RepID=A0A9C7QYF9_9GAMM|nr:addiction module toxin RelE [Serratia grimesii]